MQSSTLSAVGLHPVASNSQDLYWQHVNPVWVKLLGVLGINGRYTHSSGAELYADDGRKP